MTAEVGGGERRFANSTPEYRGLDSLRLRASAGQNDGKGKPAGGVSRRGAEPRRFGEGNLPERRSPLKKLMTFLPVSGPLGAGWKLL